MGRTSRRDKVVSLESKRKKPKAGYGEIVRLNRQAIKPVEPLNHKQKVLMSLIKACKVTFATGCPGTGKTAIAIGVGLEMLFDHTIEQIVLTRADKSIDSEFAPVPGNEDDKYAHVFRPLRENFLPFITASHLENLERNKKVKFEVLGNILGLNFHNSLIIFDEAQISTPNQMKAILTRMGKDSHAVIAGDYRDQRYIPGYNGLEDAIYRLKDNARVGRVDFGPDDIVRDDFVKDIILAYRNVVGDVDTDDLDEIDL